MKAKTMLKMLVTGTLVAAMAFTASAAFAKKNTYANQFSDVKETSWYAKEVASAYELGFVEGVSDTEYSPNTTVTVAQGITMAARVHAEANGKTIAKTGEKWYDMYVKYAKDNKIITEYQFDDFSREIKRFEMAELFHDAMGKDYYNAVNDVVFVPDLPVGAMYTDKILTLYNAGVVMGNDEYGTFSPDANIKRSECAAIINRVAIPENRQKKTLSKFSTKDAYTLVYNSGMSSAKEGINSGWVLDNRGGSARVSNTGFGAVGDVSEKYAAAYVREFNYIDAGRFVMELNLTSKDNGAFIQFRDVNENTVYMLKIVDGKWSIMGGDATYKALAPANGKTLFRVVIDLDKGVSETFIDGVNYGELKLHSNNLLSFRAGIDEKGTGSLSIGEINIVANYGMYDDFNLFGVESVYNWTVTEGVSISNEELMFGSNGGTATKTFNPVSGVVVAENYFISRAGKDFTINVGDVIAVEVKEKKLVAGGKELYSLTQNMWYRLRVDADTNAGSAKIWLNGRVIGTAPLAKKAPVSSLGITATGLLGVDNIKVYEKIKHSDYVPAPTTKASLDDYIVAMNICSLWRNGTHYGWSCITPYDDRKPAIGYFDEGVPETADWEIKYMVEHGIDVQAFCWYGDNGAGPIKTPSWGAQLHDGFMYAEYSDYMYYILQWETSATVKFGSGQFRNYVIPYWFENYFLDSRYLKVDNKLVLSIYNIEALSTNQYFGSQAKAKAELDYLEKKAKEYGFDGVIYVASGRPSAQLEALGVDGTYAYSWGEDGRKIEKNKQEITNAAKSSEKVHGIPTASVGFDSIPWHHIKYGLIPYEDWETLLTWIRDEHLPGDKSKPDWSEKFVWLSTWNEFGEGTIIWPSGQQEGNTFGYVDGVRNTLTNLPKEHVDVVPTARQKDRVTHLYPQYARLLRREGWYKHDTTLEQAKKEPANKLFVNDVDILGNTEEEFHIPPVVKNGKAYFPFNPSTCVNFILNCYFEWREDVGTLKIAANGHEVKFEVGNNLYLKDGVLTDLGYVVETLDDLPLLDFVKLAKDLGYKVEEKDGNVYIFTDTYEDLWKNIGERKTGAWDFNLYDSEGWDSTHFELSVGGGFMTMVTNGNNPGDPSATNSNIPEDFFTKRFTDLEMRVAYNFDAPYAHSITLYYTTDKDTVWNEEKSIKFQMQETDTQGEFKVYKTSLLDHTAWQSAERITGLRLDPFNCQGTFIVDYIRFIEDPDFVYVAPVKKEFAIENGDAETPNLIAFYSSNTKISIIEDPDNKKNHVYYVESYPGNTYAYFRHAAEFEPGATYHIEFDIKLVGNNVDDPKQDNSSFCANMRYQDKEASGGIEHIIRPGQGTSVKAEISYNDGWVHYVGAHTVANIESNKGAEFTIYVNPKNGIGFDFYLDNIVCRKLSETEKAKADPASVFTWDWEKGTRYSFDKAEDIKAFTFSGASGKVEDGKLVLTAEKGDPQAQLSNLKIDAKKAVAVAVKYKAEGVDFTKNYLEIFFATDKEGDLSQDKSGHVYFSEYKDEGDGYYTAVVNMSVVEKWKDTITTVRIDPANSLGTYYIDEIMIMEIDE